MKGCVWCGLAEPHGRTRPSSRSFKFFGHTQFGGIFLISHVYSCTSLCAPPHRFYFCPRSSSLLLSELESDLMFSAEGCSDRGRRRPLCRSLLVCRLPGGSGGAARETVSMQIYGGLRQGPVKTVDAVVWLCCIHSHSAPPQLIPVLLPCVCTPRGTSLLQRAHVRVRRRQTCALKPEMPPF